LRDWSKRSVAGADKKLHPKKVSPSPLRTPNRTGPPVRQPLPSHPARLASQPNLGYTLFLPTNPFARRNTENCSETNSTYHPLPSTPRSLSWLILLRFIRPPSREVILDWLKYLNNSITRLRELARAILWNIMIDIMAQSQIYTTIECLFNFFYCHYYTKD